MIDQVNETELFNLLKQLESNELSKNTCLVIDDYIPDIQATGFLRRKVCTFLIDTIRKMGSNEILKKLALIEPFLLIESFIKYCLSNRVSSTEERGTNNNYFKKVHRYCTIIE